MTKNAERREKFRILGAAITAQQSNEMAWKDRLGEHGYVFISQPIDDFAVSSRLGNGRTRGTKGPCMKSVHWLRGVVMESK